MRERPDLVLVNMNEIMRERMRERENEREGMRDVT
jgi:hypothetical protein